MTRNEIIKLYKVYKSELIERYPATGVHSLIPPMPQLRHVTLIPKRASSWLRVREPASGPKLQPQSSVPLIKISRHHV